MSNVGLHSAAPIPLAIDGANAQISAPVLLEVIGFIAIRPTYFDKNAVFGQQICNMQQLAERPNLGSKSVCAFSGARLRVGIGQGPRRRTSAQLQSLAKRSAPSSDLIKQWRLVAEEHRHSGIALLTLAVVHFGETQTVLARRQVVLDAAYQAHPDRFVRRPPKPTSLPSQVWINKPVLSGEKTEEGSQ